MYFALTQNQSCNSSKGCLHGKLFFYILPSESIGETKIKFKTHKRTSDFIRYREVYGDENSEQTNLIMRFFSPPPKLNLFYILHEKRSSYQAETVELYTQS